MKKSLSNPNTDDPKPEKETEAIRNRAQELDQLKNTFIALASHELRTPMNLVQGYLELGLEELNHDLDQARDYLKLAKSNSQRMMRIVEELTDFAKLQRGKEITNMSPVRIESAFRQTYQFLKPNLDLKNIHLVVNIPDQVLKFEFDQDSLLVIFRNILSNAAKFSPQGSTVLISGSIQDRWVRIQFIDQADPIPADKQETIFTDFRQLENYLTRRYEGMGLGLAVARRTARLLQGDILLDVRDDGNTFTVKLPCKD